MKLSEIKQKYYNNLDGKTFEKIISADTITSNIKKKKLGCYAKWLLYIYLKNNLKLEDLYKATEYIQIFDKLKKSKKLENNDIYIYNTLPELFAIVSPYIETHIISKNDEIKYTKLKEAKLFYEDDDWQVIIPLTHKSAQIYGENTQWCTASREASTLFHHYTQHGALYININKKTKRKFQFHFNSGQYMDEKDSRVNIFDLCLSDNLMSAYLNLNDKSFLKNAVEHSANKLIVDKAFNLLLIMKPTKEELKFLLSQCGIDDVVIKIWRKLLSKQPNKDDLLFIISHVQNEMIIEKSTNILFEMSPSRKQLDTIAMYCKSEDNIMKVKKKLNQSRF